MDTVTVLLPATRRPMVIREALRGRLRRDHGWPVNEDAAHEYFRQRSRIDRFSDFTDSSARWYRKPLEASQLLAAALAGSPAILDAGCGRGDLLQWLPSRLHSSYLGIDQDAGAVSAAASRYRGARFARLDMRDDGALAGQRFQLAFLINVLPYIEDASRLLRRLQHVVTDGLLVVQDPWPGPYWEREFGGFRILLRHPDRFPELAEESSWKIAERVILATGRVGRRPLLRISALTVLVNSLPTADPGGRHAD